MDMDNAIFKWTADIDNIIYWDIAVTSGSVWRVTERLKYRQRAARCRCNAICILTASFETQFLSSCFHFFAVYSIINVMKECIPFTKIKRDRNWTIFLFVVYNLNLKYHNLIKAAWQCDMSWELLHWSQSSHRPAPEQPSRRLQPWRRLRMRRLVSWAPASSARAGPWYSPARASAWYCTMWSRAKWPKQ